MIKRIICLLSAVMVATSTCFAWTAESFLGNDYDESDYYSFDSVSSVPMLMSVESSDSGMSDNLFLSTSGWELTSGSFGFVRDVYYDFYIPNQGTLELFNIQSVAIPLSFDDLISTSTQFTFQGVSTSFSAYSPDNSSVSNVSYYPSRIAAGEVIFSYPVTSTGKDIEFSFDLDAFLHTVQDGSNYRNNFDFVISIYVNGNEVSSGSDPFVNNSLLYSSPDPITSIGVGYSWPADSIIGPSDVADLSVSVWSGFYESVFKYDILESDDALGIFNGQAQNDINQHNQYESEWTGSMTDNFNALQIENFNFPSDLVSGFALITGIFNDLWYALGDYKIVYVFPLTLAIALLLIGRISRFEGSKATRERSARIRAESRSGRGG